MDYIEKDKHYLDFLYNWNNQYSLFEKEEEALEYMIDRLKSVMINLDRRICELNARLIHISISRKEGK
jgi:hypothetical protein